MQNIRPIERLCAPDGSGPVWATLLVGNGIACATLPGVTCPISTPGFHFVNSESDIGWAIAVDASGNVYVAGSTNSAGFPVTDGVVQTQYADPRGLVSQGFVTKLSADGSSLVYSTYIGTVYGEYLLALALDSEGDVIVGGVTYSSAFPTTPGVPLPGPLPRPGGGGFLVKLDPQASSFVYATYTGDGNVSGIAVDSAGNAYITGGFGSPSFPITPGLWAGALGTGETASDRLVSSQLPISVLVTAGNRPPVHAATVLYAGSAPTQSDGVMQINFVPPNSPYLTINPAAWVTVQAGTAQSPGILVSVNP